jgi:hypothetical protein
MEPGDFSFIEDADSRNMLDSMYKAVTVTENWENLKVDPGEGGFMFSSDPRTSQTVGEITDADAYKGHSGSSFGWTIRNMQKIAKSGWKAYYANHIKKQLEDEVAKHNALYEEAKTLYNAVNARYLKQTTPELIEHYRKIERTEHVVFKMTLDNYCAAIAKLEEWVKTE